MLGANLGLLVYGEVSVTYSGQLPYIPGLKFIKTLFLCYQVKGLIISVLHGNTNMKCERHKSKIIIVRKTQGLPYKKVCPKIAVYRPNPNQRIMVNLLQDHFAPLPSASQLDTRHVLHILV